MSTVENQRVDDDDVFAEQILEGSGLDLHAMASLPRWRKAR
jgi:hypothetical protein